uniref:Restriction endonuclease n=1 Tax=Rhabditophanes sp. KR3021 TaxID=114890 RepID=A0AC35UHU0_9BILA
MTQPPNNNSATSELIDKIEPFIFATLYECQAVPIRLKILLDSILDNLPVPIKERMLVSVGWDGESYGQGYIKQKEVSLIGILKNDLSKVT